MQNWGVGELVYRTSMLLLYPTLVLLGLGFSPHDVAPRRSGSGRVGFAILAKTGVWRQLRDIALDDRSPSVPSLAAIVQSRWQHPQLKRFVTLLLDEIRRGPRHTLAARIDHLTGQIEAALAKDVNRIRVSVRLGPLLGLVGTLIPSRTRPDGPQRRRSGPALVAIGGCLFYDCRRITDRRHQLCHRLGPGPRRRSGGGRRAIGGQPRRHSSGSALRR